MMFLGIPFAHASFEPVGTGARSSALGAAYSTVANDVYALSENPAGLVYLKRKEFSGTYALIHPGLDDGSKITHSFVAYGHPITPEKGTIGFSLYQLSLEGYYKERTFTVGYGKRIKQRWAVGGSVKQLYRSFGVPQGRTSNNGVTDPSKTDPAFSDGDNKWNIGFDLGAIYRPFYNYSYGLAILNVNEPNLSISGRNNDPTSMTLQGGMAYSDGDLTLMTALDSRKSASGINRDLHFTMAGEKWWVGSAFSNGDLAFRGSLAFGSRSYTQLAAGFSFRLESMQMDYGFLMPLRGATLGTTQGSHRLTLTLRFGSVIVEPDYEVRMRSAEIELKKSEKKLALAQEEARRAAEELKTYKAESEKRAGEKQRLQIPMDLKAQAAQFAEAMERYWKKKSSGASNEDRIATLHQILETFKDKDLDLSVAQIELTGLEGEKMRSEEDLAVSWNYYQKIAARGTSIPEKILLLNTIIDRFSKTGADLFKVREELRSLKNQ